MCNLAGEDPCSSQQVREVATAIVDQGLDKLGYLYIELDDCWSATTRSPAGELQPDIARFPEGMASLADWVHSRGLRLGLCECWGGSLARPPALAVCCATCEFGPASAPAGCDHRYLRGHEDV